MGRGTIGRLVDLGHIGERGRGGEVLTLDPSEECPEEDEECTCETMVERAARQVAAVGEQAKWTPLERLAVRTQEIPNIWNEDADPEPAPPADAKAVEAHWSDGWLMFEDGEGNPLAKVHHPHAERDGGDESCPP